VIVNKRLLLRAKHGAFSRAGGMKLTSTKAAALRCGISSMPPPPRLFLEVADHRSRPAALLVKAGDKVRKFQQLSRTVDLSQAPVFSPLSATVAAISRDAHTRRTTIRLDILASDENAESETLPPLTDYGSLTAAQITERIAILGVSGLGGRGMPVAHKLAAAKKRRVQQLIINAVESDPDISADEAMIRERSKAVVEGARILQRASSAERCGIAISKEKKAAIAALRAALAGSDIELLILPTHYPLGEEHRLIYALFGTETAPSASILDAGFLCFNAATAHAVALAVNRGEPMISRIVSVDGPTPLRPQNCEVLFGTPIWHLLEVCGADPAQKDRTLINGSMRGQLLENTQAVVHSGVRGVRILDASELLQSDELERNCINCGHCVSACPVNLQPQALFRASRARDTFQLAALGLEDCIDCRLCDQVCPSHIPLRDYFGAGRSEMRLWQGSVDRADHFRNRFDAHQARAERKLRRPQSVALAARQSDSKTEFSRTSAKAEIAAAVARVKARRAERAEDQGSPRKDDD